MRAQAARMHGRLCVLRCSSRARPVVIFQMCAHASTHPLLQALVDLQGRFFAGREVEASFFEEERFAKRELAPLASEVRR